MLYREKIDFDLVSLYSHDLKQLPANHEILSVTDNMGGVLARREYIKLIGFPLLTRDFRAELTDVLTDKGIKSFVEIEAGNAPISILLDQEGFHGKAYTLDPDGMKHHWGIEKSPVFEYAHNKGLLEFADIRELTLKEIPDLVVVSWIPYRGGEEVIKFFNNQSRLPEYFMVIGEGEGGCTASAKFFDWLNDTYEEDYRFEDFVSFDAIYDNCVLYKLQ
jgi:hypothetical protein